MSEVCKQDIPYADLNKVIPYSENFVIQGFSVLNEIQSENVFTSFGFASETFYPPINEDDLPAYFESSGSLDAPSKSLSRKEQGALRYSLFKNKPYAKCSICNKEFPVNFLVAAHVKKRSECSKEERLDFKNIATPMCKFGCDELYEKGVIGVGAGKVVRVKGAKLTACVELYLSAITGNTVSSWDLSSSNYYDWHLSKHSD
ncbi:MAG TPA: HNH endonuclease [Cycloclasticus sp.]|nr:HNH endonuclease [Cycloclasticus sp.]